MHAWITPIDYYWGEPPLLRIAPDSDTRTMARRLSRTATLDGGAVVTDGGYSDADRTFTLTLEDVTATLVDQIAAIADTGPCYCALDHGLYAGYVKDYAFNSPQSARLTFWVTSKIA